MSPAWRCCRTSGTRRGFAEPMLRAAILFLWSAWGGHAALAAAALLALQVHAIYRVPAAAFVTLLP